MPTLSFHTSDETDRAIRALALQQGVGPSALVSQLVDEGLKMRRFPGIIFRDGPTGRRAALAGSLDVWELISILGDFADDDETVLATYPSLSDSVLKTARAYRAAYPDEIDTRIAMSKQSEEESSHSLPALFAVAKQPRRARFLRARQQAGQRRGRTMKR
jgi:hypothetical protein